MNAMVENFRQMGSFKIFAVGGAALVLIAFFMLMSMGSSGPILSPLYANLSADDSRMIVEELERSGIKYEARAGGAEVLVESDSLLRTRLLLAQQGLPSSGSDVGNEIFDKSEALGTSNFVLNVNKLRALEGELARTITAFSKVDTARVHLVVPKRELFRRERREPTASISVKIRATKLNKEEISAIRHLVATAVPGLKPSKITIVDNKGHLLARGMEDENDIEYQTNTSQEYQAAFEKKTKATIESLLERTLGMGSVKAEVTADIDFDRIEINSETFDPEGQVARSVQSVEEIELEDEQDKRNNVTVGNNLPDANAGEAGLQSKRETRRNDETTNFEISKRVESHVREVGTVNKLSIAVLVDGVYSLNEEEERVYEPRAEAELAQIRALVESAVGYDESRGDVVEVINMKFASAQEEIFEESPLDWIKDDLDNIIQTVVLGGVAILVILLIVRPLIASAIASSQATSEEDDLEQTLLGGSIMAQLPDLTENDEDDDDELISISQVKGGIKSSVYRQISEMIEQHPDETLTVLRQWAFPNHQQ